ncbi:hypothetical protein OH76DRAFT_1180105 [Lentinus brumalis]|uniref:Uncharacterized protein n=1 Tax=Lentinus brumalis TaxID=2498619 RepID=A0A371CTW0_9APHY|nr:hypothetical protein OH76DRAFT_1180105 [Polyporus brumalis]
MKHLYHDVDRGCQSRAICAKRTLDSSDTKTYLLILTADTSLSSEVDADNAPSSSSSSSQPPSATQVSQTPELITPADCCLTSSSRNSQYIESGLGGH